MTLKLAEKFDHKLSPVFIFGKFTVGWSIVCFNWYIHFSCYYITLFVLLYNTFRVIIIGKHRRNHVLLWDIRLLEYFLLMKEQIRVSRWCVLKKYFALKRHLFFFFRYNIIDEVIWIYSKTYLFTWAHDGSIYEWKHLLNQSAKFGEFNDNANQR